MVGLTEDLESFVDILESTLPRFFAGAAKMFRSSDKLSHIRYAVVDAKRTLSLFLGPTYLCLPK